MGDILIPLIPVVVGFILLLALLIPSIVLNAMGFMFVSQFWVQLSNGLKRVDNLVTATSTDMWLEPGVKEYKTDVLYNPAKGILRRKGDHTHADDNKFKNNSAIKWGKNTTLFYWVGKIWPKGISWMAAQQRVLEIAGLHITRDGLVKNQFCSTSDVKIGDGDKLNKVLSKMGITKPYRTADPEATLKYNEYLCLIVGSDKKKATTLIKKYVNSGFNADDEEFQEKIKEYLIVPDTEKKDDDTIKDAKIQLVEEIKMVCDTCRDILVPPTVVALSEMMKACPDTAQVDEQLARLKAVIVRKSKANAGQGDTWKLILGMLGAFCAGAGVVILYGMVVQG